MKKEITGHQYEYECADCLRRRGFSKVTVTKSSGDHGIDILATYDNTRYAIQCKYYSGPVGNKAVQEAYTGCAFYQCDIPVVLSNSTFTQNAFCEAKAIGVQLWANNNIPIGEPAQNKYTNTSSLVLLFVFLVIIVCCGGFYWHSLGVFPVTIIVLFIIICLYSSKQTKSSKQAESSKQKPKENHFMKDEMSNEEALLYAMKCRRHMEEKDYMEKLGISQNNDEDE